MTNVLHRLSIWGESRVTGVVVVALSAVVGLLLIGRWTLGIFTSGSVDVSLHYALVYWFSHHWSLPAAVNDTTLATMTKYPPGAYVLTALVGRVVGSAFRGMQLVAIAGIVLVWCAIGALLAVLPGRRRWAALAALAVFLVLDRSGGPLQIQVHGYEIIGNYFFAEAASQAIFWWVVWFAVRRLAAGRSPLSTAVPVAVVAVLTTVVYLLPAVELLFFAGCLSAYELVQRWRAGRHSVRSLAAPAALPAVTAVLIVLTPWFRSMRTIAGHNGSLDVPYFSGLAGYIGVAVATAIVSLLILVVAARRTRERATRAVLQGLAFLGISIAGPCLVQALALADGQGSPYAVKKYIFGLLTVLVVDVCALAAAAVPLGVGDLGRSKGSTRFAAVVALAALAAFSVFSHQGAAYSMSTITTLERNINDVATAAHLRGNGRASAIDLPGSAPTLDLAFSMTTFAAPFGLVSTTVLVGQPDLASAEFVTGVGSQFDAHACRRSGPRDGMVVIGTLCWRQTVGACRSVDVLGQSGAPFDPRTGGGPLFDPRLGGFSFPEPTGRWTDGTTASFSCYLPRSEARKPVTVALDATAFVPYSVSHQHVTLTARGVKRRFLLTWVRPSGTLRLTVPPSASRWFDVTISLPDAVSPQEMGVSADPRVLGLFVSRIRVE